MPLFDYICQDCKQEFEALVSSSRKPVCPGCGGDRLHRKLSVFAVVNQPSGPKCAGSDACAACCGGRGQDSCPLN